MHDVIKGVVKDHRLVLIFIQYLTPPFSQMIINSPITSQSSAEPS